MSDKSEEALLQVHEIFYSQGGQKPGNDSHNHSDQIR